jgi:predicted RNA binding protein YcfA (HicA-like mRNA interferase family)
MSDTFSGKQVIFALQKWFDFKIVGQKGSHVKLHKRTDSETIITIVPLHKELAHGTLRGILRLAKIEYSEFRKRR